MKKSILTFMTGLFVLLLVFGCKSDNTNNELIGNWKKTNSEEMKLVLEITEGNNWNYYKNDTLVEKGTFEIEEESFIMKHAVEEHSHDDDANHRHEHPKDHVYKYSLNNDKTELSFITDEKISVYKKLK